MKYDAHGALKNAYRLREIRFAVTLWEKKLGEEIFCKQYISAISTEDQTVNEN